MKLPERRNTTSIVKLNEAAKRANLDVKYLSGYNTGFNDALNVIEGKERIKSPKDLGDITEGD